MYLPTNFSKKKNGESESSLHEGPTDLSHMLFRNVFEIQAIKINCFLHHVVL